MSKTYLVIVFIAFIFPPGLTMADDYFPLLCRGGEGIRVLTSVTIPLNVIGDVKNSVNATIYFTKNPTRAGTSGERLEKGSCAWLDRILSSSEPQKIVIDSKEAPVAIPSVSIVGSSDHTTKEPATVETILNLLYYPDRILRFNVRSQSNAGGSFLSIDPSSVITVVK